MDDRISKAPPLGIDLAVNSWTAPFWEAANRRELLLPRCGACGRYRFPPTPFCPHCRSQDVDWVAAPDEAFLYSYTVVTRAIVPGTEDSLPYVPAIVEFPTADNVRLISNLIGVRLDSITVGQPVRQLWHELHEGTIIPVFTTFSAASATTMVNNSSL